MNQSLYQAHILDHAQRPRNKGVLKEVDVQVDGSNPSCGDELTLYLRFEEDTIARAMFTGEGCAISQAAASMLTEKLVGMSKQDVTALTDKDMYDMLHVKVGPGREKCALLAYHALQSGLKNHG